MVVTDRFHCILKWPLQDLCHLEDTLKLGQNAAILQTIFSNSISGVRMFTAKLKFKSYFFQLSWLIYVTQLQCIKMKNIIFLPSLSSNRTTASHNFASSTKHTALLVLFFFFVLGLSVFFFFSVSVGSFSIHELYCLICSWRSWRQSFCRWWNGRDCITAWSISILERLDEVLP